MSLFLGCSNGSIIWRLVIQNNVPIVKSNENAWVRRSYVSYCQTVVGRAYI